MKPLFCTIVLFILFNSVSLAQDKNPPHNGQLKRAGYYNVEVVDCSGYLEIYLYDAYMNPIRTYGLSGVVDFHYADSTCASSRLYHYGVDGFTAEPERELYSSCEVFIRGQGTNIRTVFKDIVCVRPEE